MNNFALKATTFTIKITIHSIYKLQCIILYIVCIRYKYIDISFSSYIINVHTLNDTIVACILRVFVSLCNGRNKVTERPSFDISRRASV